MAFRPSLHASAAAALVAGALIGWISTPHLYGSQDLPERTFSVSARKYAFAPAVIEVQQNDLVRVRFAADDIPHSFTIDKYRIAKRAEPGRSVVFEFRADQPGRFPIYCNLTIDEKCREMRGELIVNAAR